MSSCARACSANSRSAIPAPVSPSRLPVGSSANRTFGLRRNGARQRHALLLAAGKLAGIMIDARGQAPPRPVRPARASNASAAPSSSSGTATFSSAVIVGIRWKDWNTMPTCAAPEARQRVLAHARDVGAGDDDAARASALRARPPPSAATTCPNPMAPAAPPSRPRRPSARRPFRMLTGPAALANVRRTSSRTMAGDSCIDDSRACSIGDMA